MYASKGKNLPKLTKLFKASKTDQIWRFAEEALPKLMNGFGGDHFKNLRH